MNLFKNKFSLAAVFTAFSALTSCQKDIVKFPSQALSQAVTPPPVPTVPPIADTFQLRVRVLVVNENGLNQKTLLIEPLYPDFNVISQNEWIFGEVKADTGTHNINLKVGPSIPHVDGFYFNTAYSDLSGYSNQTMNIHGFVSKKGGGPVGYFLNSTGDTLRKPTVIDLVPSEKAHLDVNSAALNNYNFSTDVRSGTKVPQLGNRFVLR